MKTSPISIATCGYFRMVIFGLLLPLLRKMQSFFLRCSVIAETVVVLLQPFTFSPNLFCSTSLRCSTYFMQVERMVEVDQ